MPKQYQESLRSKNAIYLSSFSEAFFNTSSVIPVWAPYQPGVTAPTTGTYTVSPGVVLQPYGDVPWYELRNAENLQVWWCDYCNGASDPRAIECCHCGAPRPRDI